MLFRYKVKPNTSPGFGNPTEYNHYITIQRYNENAHIFRWKTIADDQLCYMVCRLYPNLYESEDISFASNLSAKTLYSTLMKYGNMSNFIKAYIINVLGEAWRAQNQTDEYVDQIFKFAVTDGWNAIEIKEDKN